MGKNYYCDFCEKQFKDSGNNRKNHLKSTNHKRLRQIHYDTCLSSSEKLAAEKLKKPCQRFYKTDYVIGSCSFEDHCVFSHMTPDKRAILERQVKDHWNEQEKAKKAKREFNPKLEEWLANRDKASNKDAVHEERKNPGALTTHYQLPQRFQGLTNLPLSVLPPSQTDIDHSILTDSWG